MKLPTFALLSIRLVLGTAHAEPLPDAPAPDAQDASAPRTVPLPQTVERGGGVGRMFAWTTMILGVTGGAAAGGLYLYAKNELDSCQQHTLLGIGCGSQQQQLDDASGFAKLGGVGAGALIGASILLFAFTDARHTEIVHDGGVPEPEGLPVGGFAATAITLAGAISAHVIMSHAADDLSDPLRHPTSDETASLVSRYHYARYAAGGLYVASAGVAAMAVIDTVRALRKQARAENSTQVSLAPSSAGALVSIAGSF